ncbi:surface-adhesin E family protein [Paraburkholderia sp. BCC1884]|uniref:surface-adhesin E family protein n=1 Tax=Paraburkholderia sp. BCC1884 TaxID=2562668 RepID=UPI001183C827|nr:surface-adhesin E family protein [Paraburkholderia sp. BCC1884]
MKKLIALALLGAAASAQAADWKTVSRDSDSMIEVEQTMLKHQGSHVLAWTRQSFAKPRTVGAATYDVMLGRYDLDCANDTARLLSSTAALNGKVVDSTGYAPSDIAVIYPDSDLYEVDKAVCPR